MNKNIEFTDEEIKLIKKEIDRRVEDLRTKMEWCKRHLSAVDKEEVKQDKAESKLLNQLIKKLDLDIKEFTAEDWWDIDNPQAEITFGTFYISCISEESACAQSFFSL